MNPKAETVEELLARRKNLHMGMLKLAKEDLTLTLQAAIDAFTVLLPFSSAHATRCHQSAQVIVQSVIRMQALLRTKNSYSNFPKDRHVFVSRLILPTWISRPFPFHLPCPRPFTPPTPRTATETRFLTVELPCDSYPASPCWVLGWV